MSDIATKLTTIAENQQKVYNAGYGKGDGDGRTAGFNYGWEQGLQQGLKDGRQAEYDAFWDAYQQNGNRPTYSYAFSHSFWTDEIYNPKYPINATGASGVEYAFLRNDSVTDTKVPITVAGASPSVFYNSRALKRIPKLIFRGATNINAMFNNCTSLEELYCEGEITLTLGIAQSTKLTKASIESVVKTLSATTSGQTLTLSQTAVTNAFGSTTADEWTALIATKPNWTITLV